MDPRAVSLVTTEQPTLLSHCILSGFSVSSCSQLACMVCVCVLTEVEDADIRTGDNDLDEYHPKSTRTLFVGNLEKDTTVQDLLSKFSTFGEVIVSMAGTVYSLGVLQELHNVLAL